MRTGWLGWMVLSVGCARSGSDVDPLDAMLVAVDAAWDSRGRDGLEPVDAALEPAWELRRDDPRVRWRMARIATAWGMVATEDGDAQRRYAQARGHGLDCLDGVGGFAAQRRQGRWAEAMARVGEREQPCLAWTGLAWTRWRQVAGVAGSLDDPDIQQFVAHMPEDPDGLSVWATAISASLYDLNTAGDAFASAIATDQGDLVRKVDRLLWVDFVVEADGRFERAARLLARRADTPEEDGAKERIRRALGPARTMKAEQ